MLRKPSAIQMLVSSYLAATMVCPVAFGGKGSTAKVSDGSKTNIEVKRVLVVSKDKSELHTFIGNKTKYELDDLPTLKDTKVQRANLKNPNLDSSPQLTHLKNTNSESSPKTK